ncbi:MAG: twin-arginine translocase TatA/TatE family subunit [Opitutae bacterium]|nr:twin-arginine translocase TatA/TatE family subunit [Opitutae bacterium]
MNFDALPIAGFLGLGGSELLIILAIMLLLFGGAKLPSLAKGLGQSIKEFKKASKDDESGKPAAEEPKKTETPKNPPATGVN